MSSGSLCLETLETYVDEYHVLVNDYKSASSDQFTPLEMSLERCLRHFVHESAIEAIESSNVEFLAELRSVTILFLEVVNITAHDSHATLQNVSKAILESTYVKGGSLRQIVSDDKGFVSVISFGLSGSTYDDDCMRAAELAFLLRASIRLVSKKLDVKIGISFGHIFCGNIGTSDRCEFTLMGTHTRTSAYYCHFVSLTSRRECRLT